MTSLVVRCACQLLSFPTPQHTSKPAPHANIQSPTPFSHADSTVLSVLPIATPILKNFGGERHTRPSQEFARAREHHNQVVHGATCTIPNLRKHCCLALATSVLPLFVPRTTLALLTHEGLPIQKKKQTKQMQLSKEHKTLKLGKQPWNVHAYTQQKGLQSLTIPTGNYAE